MGDSEGVHSVFVRKPEGMKQLGRPRCRWQDDIKVDLKEVACAGID